ncbi:DUF4097 family beta strand repeat-containing protein [Glutamicibacter sp.]|uniref:DUF4097 family beta strand repeat-containing protein n=1 Tax=Glutamicibacter sp. TaxID=1931995 RepID=UPI0028BEF1FD|nr:DUF4097 family beta strand repeat-containing protein [Glutamicibacter sp.]
MSTPTMNPLPPTPPAPRGSAKPLNIILAVLGILALMTMLISTTREAIATLNTSHVVQSVDAKGVTALDIRASTGSFNLEFAPTDQAVLDVRSSSGDEWTLERSGQTLEVRPPAGWMSFCFFGCAKDDNEITLTLPQELNDGSLDADFALGAGEFNVYGNFDDLKLNVSAGLLLMNGAARNVDATLGAGRADLTLKDVQQADLDVSAGRLDGKFSGTAPQQVDGKVSAGTLQLTVPDTVYKVTSSSSAGSVENGLQTSTSSPRTINVTTSAGSAVLIPGGMPTTGK